MFKKATALLSALCLAMSITAVFAENSDNDNSYNMVINESDVVRNIPREMYGINCEWAVGVNNRFLDQVNGEVIIAPSFAEGWKDTMVFSRMAGGSAQNFKWKDALGDYKNRATQQIWGVSNKCYLGIIEWLKAIQSVTPDIKICYTFNFKTDTLENIADVVEFLTSDGTINYNGGENWGEIRKKLGIEKPVNIYTWELGNEMDLEYWNVEQYVDYCKKVIPIVKSIDPNSKISAHVDTVAHANGEGTKGSAGRPWEDWHRAVLREVGDMIDLVSFHYYYPAGYVRRADVPLDRLEQDIKEITGSDRIKIYMSEQAPAANTQTFNPEKAFDYCLPHTIWGATGLAEFYCRAMMRESLVATTCHSIDSATWSICYRDEEGGHSLTATGEVIKSFANYGVGDMLNTQLDTFSKEEMKDIAGTAVRDKDGNINILFTNRSETLPANVNFTFQDGKYRLKTVRRIHGDVKEADNYYRAGMNYDNPNKVEITETEETGMDEIKSYTFDPLSIYVLCLEKIN